MNVLLRQRMAERGLRQGKLVQLMNDHVARTTRTLGAYSERTVYNMRRRPQHPRPVVRPGETGGAFHHRGRAGTGPERDGWPPRSRATGAIAKQLPLPHPPIPCLAGSPPATHVTSARSMPRANVECTAQSLARRHRTSKNSTLAGSDAWRTHLERRSADLQPALSSGYWIWMRRRPSRPGRAVDGCREPTRAVTGRTAPPGTGSAPPEEAGPRPRPSRLPGHARTGP